MFGPHTCVFISHNPMGDLKKLQFYLPGQMVIDTQDLSYPDAKGKSLKALTKQYLGYDIQCGKKAHDASEDAIAQMKLFKMFTPKVDNSWRLGGKRKPQEIRVKKSKMTDAQIIINDDRFLFSKVR